MIRGLQPALLLAIAPAMTAQTPVARADFAQFQDSLQTVDDTAGLRRLALWYSAGAAGRESGATLALHHGVVLLTLGQRGNARSLDVAESRFRSGTSLAPDWPYFWYELGEVSRVQSQVRAADPLELGTRVGGAQLKSATHAFAQALSIDSTFVPAAIALWKIAMQLGDTGVMLQQVLPALRRIASSDTGVLLAQGQAERLVGQSRASSALLRRYAEANSTSGVGLYQFARSAFLSADTSASEAYYHGARFDDSASVAAYRSDLVLLEPDSMLTGFDQARGEARAEWLRRFWRQRDVVDLRAEGDRLQEHFRRLVFAERNYSLKTNRRVHSTRDVLRNVGVRFDDRGVVYVRYGQPDDQVETVTFGIGPNTTWRYHRSMGDLLLHFSGGGGASEGGRLDEGGDLQDYRLVPSVFSLRAPGGGQWVEFALEDRCPIYRPYCGFNGKGGFAQDRIIAEEERLVRSSVATATGTDANDLRFRHSLDVAADAVVMGNADGISLTHLVVTLPLGENPPTQHRAESLPLRIRFSAFSHSTIAGGWIIDTVLPIRLVGGNRLLVTGDIPLTVPPGMWQYRVAIETGDSTGRVLAGDSVWSRQLANGRLELSDLALAEPARGAEWIRAPGDTVWLQADRRFSNQTDVQLAYELYGSEPDEPIRTELAFRRPGKSRSVLTLGYAETASGSVDRVRRTISLAGLDPGSYQLEVRVRSASGRQTRGTVNFEVLKSGDSSSVSGAQH